MDTVLLHHAALGGHAASLADLSLSHLPRHRLADLVATLAPRLLLLAAGPGYGKTTFLRQLAASWPGPVRWEGEAPRPGGAPEPAGDRSGPPLLVLDHGAAAPDAGSLRSLVDDRLAGEPRAMAAVAVRGRAPLPHAARLRAEGHLLELGPGDLAFRADEVARLLSGDRDPGPEVAALAAGIVQRTSGWPSLVGVFIAHLRGVHRPIAFARAEEDLAAYLEEECLATCGPDERRTLEAVALLGAVSPEGLAQLLDLEPGAVRRALDRLVAAGLLLPDGGVPSPCVRSSLAVPPDAPLRPPAVLRDHVLATLPERLGEARHRELRRLAAAHAPTQPWPVALANLRAAGETARLRDVMIERLPEILDGEEVEGALEVWRGLAEGVAPDDRPWAIVGDLLRSRVAHRAGRGEEAIAEAAVGLERSLRAGDDGEDLRAIAAAHLVRLAESEGDGETAAAARRALGEVATGAPTGAATASCGWGAALETTRHAARRLADGEHRAALLAAEDALARSRAVGSPGESSLALATLALARLAVADVGGALAALDELDTLVRGTPPSAATARVVRVVRTLLIELRPDPADASGRGPLGAAAVALPEAGSGPSVPTSSPVPPAALAALEGRALEATEFGGDPALEALDRAPLWVAVAALAAALRPGTSADTLREAVVRAADRDPCALTLLAPWLAARLDLLGPAELLAIGAETLRRPERWRGVLRARIDEPPTSGRRSPVVRSAGRLLVAVGTPEDLPRLATIAARAGRPGAGAAGRVADHRDGGADALPDALLVRGLARRFAPRIFVEDLGTVRVLLGEGQRPIDRIRRKVLALICFLLARPDLTASQDEILDALWSEADPSSGPNSLNQTIYYLRRTLEDPYDARRSPHYVSSERGMVSLEPTLVDSRSRRCLALIDQCEREGPDLVGVEERLAETYLDRFAVDFLYEPWTEAHRGSLHLRYLAAMERAIHRAAEAGDRARGIRLARHVLRIDPAADSIELALLRLYRAEGAHAAAAEQYAHYRTMLREELGIEPPALEAL